MGVARGRGKEGRCVCGMIAGQHGLCVFEFAGNASISTCGQPRGLALIQDRGCTRAGIKFTQGQRQNKVSR